MQFPATANSRAIRSGCGLTGFSTDVGPEDGVCAGGLEAACINSLKAFKIGKLKFAHSNYGQNKNLLEFLHSLLVIFDPLIVDDQSVGNGQWIGDVSFFYG